MERTRRIRERRAAMLSLMTFVSLLGICACSRIATPPGMQLLEMHIHLDGKLVLVTTFDAPDSDGPAQLWARAGSEPFAVDKKQTSIKARQENPLQAGLTGSVKITINHVKRMKTTATITDLELVRTSASSEKWFLPTAEIARAKKAAGH